MAIVLAADRVGVQAIRAENLVKVPGRRGFQTGAVPVAMTSKHSGNDRWAGGIGKGSVASVLAALGYYFASRAWLYTRRPRAR